MSLDLQTSLQHTGVASCVFLLSSLPQMYIKSNEFISGVEDENSSCPTYKSRLLHMVIFYVLTMVSLKYLVKSEKEWLYLGEYSARITLLYFLMSSPEMYIFTNSIANGSVVITEGSCPTIYGIIIHTVIFFILMTLWTYDFKLQTK